MTKNTITSNPTKVIALGSAVQALMLALYGALAVMLHRTMEEYDISAISVCGRPMHFAYKMVFILGILTAVYAFVNCRKGHIRSLRQLRTDAAALITALIMSGANAVYTSFSGSGILGYMGNVMLTGKDPIDSFFDCRTTELKYMLVTGIGVALLMIVLPVLRKAGRGNETTAPQGNDVDAASAGINGSEYFGGTTYGEH
jgi:hypothetical protein